MNRKFLRIFWAGASAVLFALLISGCSIIRPTGDDGKIYVQLTYNPDDADAMIYDADGGFPSSFDLGEYYEFNDAGTYTITYALGYNYYSSTYKYVTYFNTGYSVYNSSGYSYNWSYYINSLGYYYDVEFTVKADKGSSGFFSGVDGKDRKYTMEMGWDPDDSTCSYNLLGAALSGTTTDSDGLVTKVYTDDGLTFTLRQTKRSTPITGAADKFQVSPLKEE